MDGRVEYRNPLGQDTDHREGTYTLLIIPPLALRLSRKDLCGKLGSMTTELALSTKPSH